MKNESFFQSFVGEMVSLTINATVPTQAVINDDGVVEEVIEGPISFDGYLLDVDNEYYYLGDTSQEVSKAIRKENVISVEIVKSLNIFDKMLEDIEDKDIQ